MAVQLSLTAEQAALLMPVLQQLAAVQKGTAVGTPSASVGRDRVPFSSEAPPSSTDHEAETGMDSDSSSASIFSLEQLLTKKKKNRKSTDAQNFLHVSR